MRKKYLSALLFGALLFASAGTFTSCKDYDDDIDNINSQIKDINSKISALEAKVNTPGVYVSKIESIEGGLKVTLSDGSSYNLTQPTAPAGDQVEIAENGEWTINGKKTGWFASPYEVDQKVMAPEVIDGYWYFYDKESGELKKSDIKASGAAYVVVVGNIVTLHVPNENGEMVELVMTTADNTLANLQLTNNSFTGVGASTAGIAWAKAAKNDGWKGALGAIAKDQLLIGQIKPIEVTVLPVSFDLSASTLGLVDSEGNAAPVTITATAANTTGPITGGRAADKQGKYKLNIVMDNTVTVDNIGKIFANADNTANILYALTVDGEQVTGYEIAIDTRKGDAGETSFIAPTYNAANLKIKDASGTDVTTTAAPLNTTYTFTYTDDAICDGYLSFNSAADALKAEQAGITLDGMTMTVPATAAQKNITVKTNLLKVNGTEISGTTSFTFKASTVDQTVKVSPVTYTLSPKALTNTSADYIDINVASVFSALTADEVTKIGDISAGTANFNASFTLKQPEGQSNFLLKNNYLTFATGYGITFHEATNDGKVGNQVSSITAATGDIRKIAFLRLSINNNTVDQANAKPGSYTLYLTLHAGATANNEVKKIEIPLTIALPEFSDLFPRTTQWTGDTYSSKLLTGKTLNYGFAFNKGDDIADYSGLVITYDKVGDTQVTATTAASGTFTISNNIVKDNALITDQLATTAAFKFWGSDNLKVTSQFTTEIHSTFENPTLVYYENNVAKDVATLGAGNTIASLSVDAEGIKNGLAVKYGRGEAAVKFNEVVDGVKLVNTTATAASEVQAAAKIDGVSSATATINNTNNSVDISVGVTSGTLVVSFTDCNGVITKASIKFQ